VHELDGAQAPTLRLLDALDPALQKINRPRRRTWRRATIALERVHVRRPRTSLSAPLATRETHLSICHHVAVYSSPAFGSRVV